jgi:hypothetical protein
VANVIDGDVLDFPDPQGEYRFSGCYSCGLVYVTDPVYPYDQLCERGHMLMVEVNVELECADCPVSKSLGWFYIYHPTLNTHEGHAIRAKTFLG